jgi:RNA polymerase sigma-70 factor, ECF subfamily
VSRESNHQAGAHLDPALVAEVYEHLHRLASSFLRNERRNHTLQPSALINEAYLKLVENRPPAFTDRAHFLRLAARTMRQVLIDHSRGKSAQKRNAAIAAPLMDAASPALGRDQYLIIDQALRKLEQMDPRQAAIVELRFFGGLSVEEAAGALGFSEKTVKREWAMARVWLRGELEAE